MDNEKIANGAGEPSPAPDGCASVEKTAIGYAKRDIADGEVIDITINADGSLESDAIRFLADVTFADLHNTNMRLEERSAAE